MKLNIQKYCIYGLGFFVLLAFTTTKNTPIDFEIPKNWPKPHYDFTKNPLTEEGFQLGRQLFYDPILSKDNTISCASCHLQATGFTHVDHALSHGIYDKIGTRNSLSLQNLAWSKTFMWDGGVNHLEVQPLAPITSPVEMDESLQNVVNKLKLSKNYRIQFKTAFGDSLITGQKVLKALTQFVVNLTSSNSKYDQVQRNETEFSPQEKNGYRLFQKHCASCHKEPLFTSDTYENNGLAIDTLLKDIGRMKITNARKDYLKFKVPTLRNIQFTYPYMHDGRFNSLTEVVKHYNSIQKSPYLSKSLQKPLNLTDNERVDIVLFLKTLTDKEFLFNPKFSFPR